MNRWGIAAEPEAKVRKRDKRCVYCRAVMKGSALATGGRKSTATWEHIDNNVRNRSENNVVRRCGSCNSSKGVRKLTEWLDSEYCRQEKIDHRTVALVVRKWLREQRETKK